MSCLRVSLVVIPGLLLLLAGCGTGKGTLPVEGTVTLDGQPLDGAAVNFVPVAEGGRPARAQTDQSGKFKLTTSTPNDGALPGTYKVGVSKLEASQSQKGDSPQGAPAGTQLSGPPTGRPGPPPMPKSLVPVKYLNPDTSEIKIEVKAGMQPVKIELTK